jgi:nucleoside-diphosphate-sugar epimerase
VAGCDHSVNLPAPGGWKADDSIRDVTLHYARAKHRMESIARAAVERGGAAIGLNPPEVHGPGDSSFGTASNLIDFASSWPVFVTAGGTGIVQFRGACDTAESTRAWLKEIGRLPAAEPAPRGWGEWRCAERNKS